MPLLSLHDPLKALSVLYQRQTLKAGILVAGQAAFKLHAFILKGAEKVPSEAVKGLGYRDKAGRY